MNRNLTALFLRLSLAVCVAFLAGLGSTAAFAQPTLNLPPGSVNTTVTFSKALSLPSYFTAQFSGIPNGYDVRNAQTYLAWCAQANADLVFNVPGPTIYIISALLTL